jgi:hypothetical protein
MVNAADHRLSIPPSIFPVGLLELFAVLHCRRHGEAPRLTLSEYFKLCSACSPRFSQKSAIIFEVMSSVRPTKPSPNHSAARPLLIGAAVRLRRGGATGVIIGNSSDSDRVCVRWDDTGDTTHCLRTKLQSTR